MPLLNTADRVYIGPNLASRVYRGTNQVWPSLPVTSGCVIWLDASKLGLTNGASVNSWTNLGTGPQPTIMSTPVPTYRTNAINGLGVVRITGGQGVFRFAGTGANTDYTVIFVARRWSLRAGRVVSANYSIAPNPNILWGFWSTLYDQCYVEGWLTPNTPGTGMNWKLYSADSTSSAVARFFSNGNLLYSGAATPAKGLNGTLCVGGYDDGKTEEADCEIAEVVLYNRKLLDTERQQVEAYLRQKWAAPTILVPTDIGSNLVAWFDGGDPNTIAGTPNMNFWINKGAGSMTLQAGTYPGPTYANPTVTFAQGQILNGYSTPTTGYDMVWVGRPLPGGSNWRTLIRNVTSPHHVIIENTSTRFGTYNGGFFQAGSYTWGQVWGIGYVRIGDNALAYASRDGGALASTTTTIATGNAVPSYFGAYQGPPPDQPWGDVREIIILPYNADGYRQLMEGYLAYRWGLQSLLPAGHPYKTYPP